MRTLSRVLFFAILFVTLCGMAKLAGRMAYANEACNVREANGTLHDQSYAQCWALFVRYDEDDNR